RPGERVSVGVEDLVCSAEDVCGDIDEPSVRGEEGSESFSAVTIELDHEVVNNLESCSRCRGWCGVVQRVSFPSDGQLIEVSPRRGLVIRCCKAADSEMHESVVTKP